MRVQIAKWGNSAAVRLPKVVLDRLGVSTGAELDLIVEERGVLLKPTRPRRTLEQVLADMRDLGGASYDHGQAEWPDVLTDWPTDGETSDDERRR